MRRVDYMIGPKSFAALKAEVFMQDVVSYYQAEDTGERLAGAITEGGFGSVPILARDGKVLGIVSEFDLLKAITEGKELSKITARDIMTKEAISVTQETPAMEIIHYCRANNSSGLRWLTLKASWSASFLAETSSRDMPERPSQYGRSDLKAEV